MLQGDFFRILSIHSVGGQIQASLELNANHPIFEGHFPGQPVVPGVCMMQMVKEIVETELGFDTRLLKAEHLKFLSVINPLESSRIRAELNYDRGPAGEIRVTGILATDSIICLKCKLQLAEDPGYTTPTL